DVEIANAAAAKAKAAAAEQKAGVALLSLAQLEAAFRLKLLTQAELLAALKARHYSDDDANLIVQIAVLTMPNTSAGQDAEKQPAPPVAVKAAPLADFKRLVLRGLRTSDDYEAELRARGYSADAAALMREAIDDERA